MTPLRVTARLIGPVAYRWDGMHLDAIISQGFFAAMPREQKEELPPVDSEPVDFDLPLARIRFADDWVWSASAVHVPSMRRESRHPVRLRPADDLYARRSDKPSLELGSGRFKAHDKAVQTLAAEKLVWYAMGDASEVERLLGFVRGVGKLVHHGMGSVSSWCVDEVDEDWSVFNGDVLTRRLPLCDQTRGKGVMSYGPTRPPYHTICAERLRPCVDPIYKALIA